MASLDKGEPFFIFIVLELFWGALIWCEEVFDAPGAAEPDGFRRSAAAADWATDYLLRQSLNLFEMGFIFNVFTIADVPFCNEMGCVEVKGVEAKNNEATGSLEIL